MNKLFLTLLIMGLVLGVGVSAYSCYHPQDNIEVLSFKEVMNNKAIDYDLQNGYSKNDIITKIKYFSNCK